MTKTIDLRDYICKVIHSCNVNGYTKINESNLRLNEKPLHPSLPDEGKYLGFKIIFIPRIINREDINSLFFYPDEIKDDMSLTEILRDRNIELIDSRSEEEKDIGLSPPFWY